MFKRFLICFFKWFFLSYVVKGNFYLGRDVWFMVCFIVYFFKNRWYICLYNSYCLVWIIFCFLKIKFKIFFGDSVSYMLLFFKMFIWKLFICFVFIKIVFILYIDLYGLFYLFCEWILERDVNGFFKNVFCKKYREEIRNILVFNE